MPPYFRSHFNGTSAATIWMAPENGADQDGTDPGCNSANRGIDSEQYGNFCWICSIYLGSDARLEVEKDLISLEQETNRGKAQM